MMATEGIFSIFLGDKTPLEEIHSPYETLLFRTFLSHLIHLSLIMLWKYQLKPVQILTEALKRVGLGLLKCNL